jgi:hypothetical protein
LCRKDQPSPEDAATLPAGASSFTARSRRISCTSLPSPWPAPPTAPPSPPGR